MAQAHDGITSHRTSTSVRTNEPLVTARLHCFLSVDGLLDRRLNMIVELLQTDDLRAKLYGDAVLGEVYSQDALVVVLRYLDGVVLPNAVVIQTVWLSQPGY